MANPFRIWRKHQKAFLAILALMAMISFVVLPIVMDIMGSSPARDPVVVSTQKYGSLHQSKLWALRQNREVLRGFLQHLQQATIEAEGNPRQVMMVLYRIGTASEEDVVDTWLLSRQAEELGLVVSDETINQFLAELTTQQKVSRETVQQIMRYRHISENDLFRILRHELLAIQLENLFGISLGGITPAQRWDYYQRLNRKARIEAVPLPVANYVSQVPDPDETTLREFFEQHKNRLYVPTSPLPGFREPQRIALEYFKANVDAVKVSDEEIQRHYDQVKDKEFVQEELPEVKKPTEKRQEEKPAPAKPATESSAQEKARAAGPDAKAEEKKGAKEPIKQEPATKQSSSRALGGPFHLTAYQQDKEKQPEHAKPGEMKYVPLEKVRNRIRATLAEAKIRELLGRLQDKVMRYHEELTLYEVHKEDKTRSAQPPEKLDYRKLAKENGLGFYRTELISALEVGQLDIGQSSLEGNVPFVTYAFETLPLHRPEISQDIEGNHFLFWKTAQAEERVPAYEDAGVRERVLQAWKMVQARGRARREAERLAEQARKANKPLKEFFARQPGFVVHESEPFSWMTYGAFPAWWAQVPPEISPIRSEERDPATGAQTEIVVMPGNELMREVFRLQKGQIGVATNRPETIVYLIRVIDVTPALWEAFVAEDFGRYARVAEHDQRALFAAWREAVRAEAGLKWQREPERYRRHRGD